MSTSQVLAQLDSAILLEAGTNELEILVLQVGDLCCGVNVAKVREVLEVSRVTRLPQSHPAVEGSVYIRGQVVELINLLEFLDGPSPSSQPQPTDRMLVMEFNQRFMAFRVHGVDQILRLSWTAVQPVPAVGPTAAPVTAVVRHSDRLILMLDFESIGFAVGMCPGHNREAVARVVSRDAVFSAPILIAEDSQMITSMVRDALGAAGFKNLQTFADGQEVWDHLNRLAASLPVEQLAEEAALLITDVEMPRMDGLTLTRNLRGHAAWKSLPIVLYSSIVSKDNEKKGRQVGADAQVAKPGYEELAATIHRLLGSQAAGTTATLEGALV